MILTKKELYAGLAMHAIISGTLQAMLAGHFPDNTKQFEAVASTAVERAFQIADLMIKEINKIENHKKGV